MARRHSPTLPAIAAGLILAVGTGLPGAARQQSTERTLTVNFYAVGADGLPVSGLTPSDISIRIGGRVRPVRSLRLVTQADASTQDPLAVSAAAPPPFSTNLLSDTGRSFVLVVDDESFRPGRERPVRSAVRAFLGSLTPRDRVSVWTTPHGGIKVNLTANHDRVAAAMDVISGHGPQQETGSEAACRTRATLEALEHMLSSVTGGEGPLTVMLFTASLYGPRRDTPARVGPPGMCELTVDHFQQVGFAAGRARAHFYLVQPEDLQRRPTTAAETLAGAGFAATLNPLEGIEHLAGVTGGTILSLTRLGDATLVALARATRAYYAATVDGAPTDSAVPASLDVKVSRDGIDVRALAFIELRRPAGLSSPLRTPGEMLRVGAVFPDLPLRVAAFAAQNDPAGNMRVVTAGEPVDPAVELAAGAIGIFDTQGKMVGQINLGSELASRPVLATMVVPPGAYRVRLAAVDAAGRGGTADTELVAEMTAAGPLRLSSLVLGLWRDNAFQPRLEFTTEPVAIAYLDLTGGAAGAAVDARIELAHTLNGPAIVTTRLAIAATSDPARFNATGAIPIGALPPGDYIVRAIVGVQGQPAGRVVRTLRKAAR